jgi:hypothetical protein
MYNADVTKWLRTDRALKRPAFAKNRGPAGFGPASAMFAAACVLTMRRQATGTKADFRAY